MGSGYIPIGGHIGKFTFYNSNKMEFPEGYAALSAFQRQEYINLMRAEVSDLQAALDELNAATPRIALSQFSRSLPPAPSDLGLRLQKTLKVSKIKILGMEKFGGGAKSHAEPGFASVTQDGTVYLWDAATGLKFDAVRVGKGNMMSVSVNPTCRVAVAGGLSCSIDVYSVGQRLREMTADKMTPFSFQNGGHQPRPGKDQPQQYCLTLSGHDAAITSMQFLADNLLVSGSQDGGVHIWDIVAGNSLSSSMETNGIMAISRGSDNVFCTAASDGKLKVWDVRTRASEARWYGLSRSLTGAVFMPEGHSVLATDDTGMMMFDLRTVTSLEHYSLGGTLVTTYDVSASGRFAFIGTTVGITVPIDLLQNRVLQPLDTRRDHISSVKVIDAAVVVSNWDGNIRVYSASPATKK